MLLFFVTLDIIFGFGSHIYLFRIKKDFDCGEVLKTNKKYTKLKSYLFFLSLRTLLVVEEKLK